MKTSLDFPAEDDRPALLRLRGVSKQFGAVTAVNPTDLDIRSGDFFALLGPSGCGKSTLLRMIAGFETPSAGIIEIDGVDVSRLGPEKRPTNMVFQGYGLFPHMNVRQNVGYGLRIAGVPRSEIDGRCDEMIRLVKLEGFAERDIARLSGGQQQRVALARVLVMKPKVLLLDEPLAALDLKLRQTMQEELRRIHDEIGGTFIFVTHDQTEAMAMANRIAVMESGTITQEGSAAQIYNAPRSRFVATFIGDANLLPGRRTAGRVTLEAGPSFDQQGEDGSIFAVVRPEVIRPAGVKPVHNRITLTGTVEDSVFLGTHTRLSLRLANGESVALHSTEQSARRIAERGAVMSVEWSADEQAIVDGD